MTAVQVIPSAKRLIQSLRDMGYDFAQAVADVVDNSIEARARTVAIDIEFDGDDSWLRVADNGKGMRPGELREAMRYGSGRDYDDEDLGKFGLGLKTASMSQCQRLSVASRWNSARADISAYAWDLEHIEKTNRWEILPVDQKKMGPAIREPLKSEPGTVVLWQRLDRILGYKHPYGESARKRMAQMCRDVEQHLGMVFHRFLSEEVKQKQFKLLLNGNRVASWDPFCRHESQTKTLDEIKLPIEYEGVEGEILLKPYILPRQDEFSTPESFRNASGPSGWNQQQGFYIYRAGRMIQSGGWSNLRAPDEHNKLARIAVFFSPALDEAFKINVAKMRVQLPAQVRDVVRENIAPVIKLARQIYDKKKPQAGPRVSSSNSKLHPRPIDSKNNSPSQITSTKDSSPSSSQFSNKTLLTIDEWKDRLLSIANAQELPVVKGVLSRLLSETTGE